MIVVRVRQQDDVHLAEPRIGFVGHEAGVVEDPHAGRVFEQERAVARAYSPAWLPMGVTLTRPPWARVVPG